MAPLPGFAQESGGSSAIEEIVVTGSLIKRDNFDSSAPLKVIDQADIQSQATPNLGEVLVNQTFNYGSDFQTNTYAARGQGGVTTAANLRGLGTNATLNLIDGQRIFYTNLNNSLPQVAIERIDVLKDGASALYGSDAVAGVVNIIPRKNFEGFQASVFYQEADDLDESVFDFIMGSAMDRGHFMLAGSYKTRGQLQQTERPKFLRQGFERSGTGNPGTWLVPDRDASGALTGDYSQLADPGCGAYNGPGGTDVGSKNNYMSGQLRTVSAGQECALHFGEWWNYMNPQDQYSVYTNVRYDFTDDVSNELEMIYSYISTESRGSAQNPGGRTEEFPVVLGDHPGNPFRAMADPDGNGLQPLYAQDANNDGIPDRDPNADTNGDGVPDVILAANPYDPNSGVPFNEDVDVVALRIFGKLGTMPYSFNDDGSNSGNATFTTSDFWFQDTLTYQIPDSSWEVRAHAGYEFQRTNFDQKNTSQSALVQGLNGQLQAVPATQEPGKSYWNPFSTQQLHCVDRECSETGQPDFANTQDVVNAINIQAEDVNEYTQYVYDITATGDVWELPAGTMAIAFGYQYRLLEWDIDLNAPYNSCDWHEGGCGYDYKAQQDSNEFYAELLIPLINNDKWGNAELTFAGRQVDYGGDIGDDFSPKYAGRWQIRPWVALRASYSEAFIAPTIEQQFEPPDCGLQTMSDPITLDFSQSFRVACVPGNEALSPETADVWNVGVSFDLLDGDLSFGADWAEYKFKDRIVTAAANNVINADAANYEAAGFTPGNINEVLAWSNSPESDPRIIRDQTGLITRVNTFRTNASEMTHKALDLYARYTLPWDQWGLFRLNLEATYVDEYTYDIGLPGTTPGDAAGKQNEQLIDIPPIPQWRAVGTVNWTWNNWAAMIRGRWIDSFDLEFNSGALQAAQFAFRDDKADDIMYIDMSVSYAFQNLLGEGKETTLEVGGRNITDEYPDPLLNLGGIESFVHDIRGDMWYLRLTTDI
jgi:outer membrane receptor protein involved in Fe transport